MKKRALALVFAAFMALSVTACGGETQTAAEPAEEQAAQGEENKQEASAEKEDVVLLEQDGIKITFTGMSEEPLGPAANLLIENSGDVQYTIQSRDTSIDGFMIDPAFSADVAPGKKANSKMIFLQSDVDNNGITEIKSIETSFTALNFETFDTLFTSDTITITVSE